MAATSLRQHKRVPPLKIGEPAVRAMIDFRRDPLVTVAEETPLEQVLDEMFRSGVRALLVVREHTMSGLVTIEQARGERGRLTPLQVVSNAAQRELRVVDVMTPSTDVPAVEWQMIAGAQIRDLIEIFERSGVQDMVVLESEEPNFSRVRGLIHRGRLVRQLGLHWSSSSGFTDEAAIG